MDAMADSLRGKPIFIEHDGDNTGKVGTIHHAWKTKDAKLNILFETDPTCFKGALASRLIRHGVCNELSLGHNCKINFSDSDMKIGEKTPVEVSIVVKGDRPNTAIRGWVTEAARSRSQKQDPRHLDDTTQYILQEDSQHQTSSASLPPTMSTSETTTEPVAQTESTDSKTESPASEMQELLEQLRAQSELVAKQKLEHEANAKRMAELSERVTKYEKVGTERRKRALDGAVKDWVGKMVETHTKELGPYESQLKELLGAMTREDAEPMVQMLSCAASASAASTSKLNKAYQDLKDAQQSAKRYKKQYEDTQKPAFADPSQRFKAPDAPAPPSSAPAAPKSDIYSRMFTRKSTSEVQRGGGLMKTNPDLWSAIRSSASQMPSGGARNPAFDTSMFSESKRKSWGVA